VCCLHSSIDVVVRNWREIVVLANSKKFNTTIPLQTEVWAILWATQIVTDIGLEMVCFESDSKICINALCSLGVEIPLCVQSCLSVILDCFGSHLSWSCLCVKRWANRVPPLFGWVVSQELFVGSFDFCTGSAPWSPVPTLNFKKCSP
jgi:hypothetical protein